MQTPERLVACHDCDLLHEYKPIPPGQTAHCRRCGAELYQHKKNSLERTFALAVAAFVLLIVANSFPFLALKVEGNEVHTTLISGVYELYKQDMILLAALVFFTSIFAPIVEVGCLLYVLLPLHYGRVFPYALFMFRLLRKLEPWSMMEVFMLGILVSVVKLSSMAEIVPGVAVWSFAVLIMLLAWVASAMDAKEVWDELGKRL